MAKTAKRLLNSMYPFLKIYVPELEENREFNAGVLVLEADDPAYDHILKTATEDPFISIHSTSEDGQETQVKVSAQRNVVCDICAPAQTFATGDERDIHVAALHTVAPKLNAEGEITGDVQPGTTRVQRGIVSTSSIAGAEPTEARPEVEIKVTPEQKEAAEARPPVSADIQPEQQASDIAARVIKEASSTQGQQVAEARAIESEERKDEAAAKAAPKKPATASTRKRSSKRTAKRK